MLDKKSSDFLWKIVLCGDSFVGKTTIRKRAMGEHFAEEYISTVGADFSSYKLKFGDLSIGFQVWDLAGQDKYKYIRSSFYGGATGCFLVYDVTNPKSLKSLSNWVDEAIRYSNGTIDIFIICANKIDLKNRREIPREMGENYAEALRESSGLQCIYIETSALTGENIDVAFDSMAKCLLEREGITPLKEKQPKKVEEVAKKETIDAEKLIAPPATQKKIESEKTHAQSTAKTEMKKVMINDNTSLETEKLIAEVMSVLDETNDVIIGKELTDEGEKVITVPKSSIQEQEIVEEEPAVTPEMERVLQVINLKLDSLTNRLKDLEQEITAVKLESMREDEVLPKSEIDTPIEKTMEELTLEEVDEGEEEDDEEEQIPALVQEDEIEVIEEQESTTEESKEDVLDQDQRVLESLLDMEPLLMEDKEEEEEEEIEEITSEESEIIDNNEAEEETDETLATAVEELVDIPDEEYVDIPDNEGIEPIEEEHVPSNEKIIGTELTSAMISELKDMSEEGQEPQKKTPIQPLSTKTNEEKTICSICGNPTKYIRKYNKYYCSKCGRYII